MHSVNREPLGRVDVSMLLVGDCCYGDDLNAILGVPEGGVSAMRSVKPMGGCTVGGTVGSTVGLATIGECSSMIAC